MDFQSFKDTRDSDVRALITGADILRLHTPGDDLVRHHGHCAGYGGFLAWERMRCFESHAFTEYVKEMQSLIQFFPVSLAFPVGTGTVEMLLSTNARREHEVVGDGPCTLSVMLDALPGVAPGERTGWIALAFHPCLYDGAFNTLACMALLRLCRYFPEAVRLEWRRRDGSVYVAPNANVHLNRSRWLLALAMCEQYEQMGVLPNRTYLPPELASSLHLPELESAVWP